MHARTKNLYYILMQIRRLLFPNELFHRLPFFDNAFKMTAFTILQTVCLLK